MDHNELGVLSREDIEAVVRSREHRNELRGFNMGIEAAARAADDYAAQCSGGSGEGGQGYRNLAATIRRKLRTS